MTPDPQVTSNRDLARGRRIWTWAPLVCIVLFVLIYLAAVWTRNGQLYENAALTGSRLIPGNSLRDASETLSAISRASLAVATIAIGAIGLLRRQPRLAVAGVAIIGLGVIGTEVLKHYVLPRPELVNAVADNLHNSFPSGHTVIAMTILIATLIVVPYRWRGLAMFIVMSWATAIGAATIAAHWHRLSDTLGSNLIALTLGAVASLWLLRTGSVVPAPQRRYIFRVGYVLWLSIVAIGALGLGILLATLTLSRVPVGSTDFDVNIYLAVHSLALAGSTLTALLFWWSWRRLETVSPGNTVFSGQVSAQ